MCFARGEGWVMNTQSLINLRTKKTAVLIIDARLAARRTPEECAAAIGITPEAYRAFETGQQTPSLPELEALAFFLGVTLDHFWGKASLSQKKEGQPLPNLAQVRQLRNRMISARLGLERSNANLSLDELAEKTGLTPEILEKYEKEAAPIPLAQLEILTKKLGIPIEDLFDQKGPAGKQRKEQEMMALFKDLPEELQQFVCQPVNRPFLELALHFQGMPVDKLRSIAESLLEITY
jgi:transcriptional regulator with XRE-family HTH domain